MFQHEKLLAYRKAFAAAVAMDKIAYAIPDSHAYLRDQLRRASSSVAFNLAEGAGEFSHGDKAKFYRIARRSATESAAILEFIEATILGPHACAEARALLNETVALLTRLIVVHSAK